MAHPYTFVARTHVDAPPGEAFAYHAREGAFERLSPPFDPVEIERRDGSIAVGDRTIVRVPVGPLKLRWEAVHTELVPGVRFRDEQVSGPFARWEHTHTVEPDGEGAVLEDRVVYELPMGALGRTFGGGFARSNLERVFTYRHSTFAGDLAAHARAGLAPQRIAITGATGLVGSALGPYFSVGGHDVVRLVRRGVDGVVFDPDRGEIDEAKLEALDSVVHLAGENIAGGRWTEERKRKILESRVKTTDALVAALSSRAKKPRVLVCASAVGYYGDTRSPVDESSPKGAGFLADVCEAWERSARRAEDAGIRVVHARFGAVLSPRGGALAKMLPAFKSGVGGPVGPRDTPFPWIALDDLLDVLLACIARDTLRGPVNVVAPELTTQGDLAKTMGHVLKRPAFMPVPSPAVRALFGEMGEELLLQGAPVVPKKLIAEGHPFRFSTLDAALRHLLGVNRREFAA